MKKLFKLVINKSNDGFIANLEVSKIVDEFTTLTVEKVAGCNGKLPENRYLLTQSENFWANYKAVREHPNVGKVSNFKPRKGNILNIPFEQYAVVTRKCQDSLDRLVQEFSDWLNAPDFAEFSES